MENIVLNGKTYEFPEIDFGDLEVSEAVARGVDVGLAYKERINTVDKSNLSDVTAVMREYCEDMMDIIDEVLGEGASNEIFGGRTNLTNIVNVFAQIQDGVTDAFRRGQEEMAAHGANRAQRRAAAQNQTRGVKTGKHSGAKKAPKIRVVENESSDE